MLVAVELPARQGAFEGRSCGHKGYDWTCILRATDDGAARNGGASASMVSPLKTSNVAVEVELQRAELLQLAVDSQRPRESLSVQEHVQ
jgi:hypothetical protein